jgi:hypothetical protein
VFPFPFQGMMERETCFRFSFRNHSLLVDLETKTCFRFHQSLVNSGKRSRQIGAGKSARGRQICPRAKTDKSGKEIHHSFWQGMDQTKKPNFLPQRFQTKTFPTNRKNNQTKKTNWILTTGSRPKWISHHLCQYQRSSM